MSNNSPFLSHIPRTVNLWITVASSCPRHRLGTRNSGLGSSFLNKSWHFRLGLHCCLCSSQCHVNPNLRHCLIMAILSPPVYLCSTPWFTLSLVCKMCDCAHSEPGNQHTALIYVADAKTYSPLKMSALDIIHSLLLQWYITLPFWLHFNGLQNVDAVHSDMDEWLGHMLTY